MSKFTSLEETTLRSRENLRMPHNKTSGCVVPGERLGDDAGVKAKLLRLCHMLSCLAHFLNELLMFSSLNSYHFAFVF